MFAFFYNVALLGMYLCTLPLIIFKKIYYGKYQYSIAQRLGFDFPSIGCKDKYIIWVHAVSVGEIHAVAALVRSLKKRIKNPYIIISSITETGHSEAEKLFSCADSIVFLPLDLSWIIRPIIKKNPPNLVLISETDLWYNFLSICKNFGAHIALVNGKISLKSSHRLKFFNVFAKKIFPLFDQIMVQSDLYRQRFTEAGCHKSKITVTGNLKLDGEFSLIKEEELEVWKKELGIGLNHRVIVIGSTHYPEEKLLIGRLKTLWESDPDIKFVIVPRHPERFDEVADYLSNMDIPFLRLSTTKYKKGDEKAILIDSMGLLKKCYQLADIAIVAGSYSEKVGGHNIIEPCWYGVPTIFGPYMYNQLELVNLVKKYRAGLQVEVDELPKTIAQLLASDEEKNLLGQGGRRLIDNNKGATKTTVELIISAID